MDPLTEFFYATFQIFWLLGFVGIITFPILFTLFWKKWMPKAARTLFWANRRGTPPLLLVHDSGRGELTTVIERKGEGIVITREGKYKILPRVMPKTPLEDKIVKSLTEAAQQQAAQDGTDSEAQPVEIEVDVPEGADRPSLLSVVKDKFILDYRDWILKRCMLVGMKMPFWVGYTGKLCLLNPEALALYEAGEMVVQTEDKTMFNPNSIADKLLENAMKPLLLIDPRKIQQIIYNGFDQSQIAGVVADTEDIMRLGKGISKGTLAAIMILVVIALLGLGMFLVPQLLQGGGGMAPAVVQNLMRLFR